MAWVLNRPIVRLCNGCFVEMTLFEETPPSTDGGLEHISYITECVHVLCRHCRVRGGERCIVCNANTRYMIISNEMPPRYRAYFDYLMKVQTKLDKLLFYYTYLAALSASKFFFKRQVLRQKCTHAENQLNESKENYHRTLNDKHQMDIIYKTIHDENRRQGRGYPLGNPRNPSRDPAELLSQILHMGPTSTLYTANGDDNMTSLTTSNRLENGFASRAAEFGLASDPEHIVQFDD